MEDDLENIIPVNNIQYSQGSAELRVKTVKKDDKGFTETKIETLKVVGHSKQICYSLPFSRTRPVENTICLSIEDVVQATAVHDFCWRVFERIDFRRVLIYGKVAVVNVFSKEGKTRYKLVVDDGTGEISGTMALTKEAKLALSNTTGRLTMERNKLKRIKEIGINIHGTYYPPDSHECQSVLRSCAILHSMVGQSISDSRKDFKQGPLAQKALLLANLYKNNTNSQVQLNIIDISLNDKIELSWKRQLNKLYLKEYTKNI